VKAGLVLPYLLEKIMNEDLKTFLIALVVVPVLYVLLVLMMSF